MAGLIARSLAKCSVGWRRRTTGQAVTADGGRDRLEPIPGTVSRRFFDVGIAEQHALVLAAGLAVGEAAGRSYVLNFPAEGYGQLIMTFACRSCRWYWPSTEAV